MLSSYLLALCSGLLVYLVMLLDAKYIDPNDKPVSPKIPLFVTMIVWFIVVFYKTESSVPVLKQKAMVGGFYS